MLFTLVVAVLFAIPKLALYLLCVLSFLFFILYVPLILASAFLSEAKNQQLDVENNKTFVVLAKFHVWNVVLFLASISAVYVRNFLESGVKNYLAD